MKKVPQTDTASFDPTITYDQSRRAVAVLDHVLDTEVQDLLSQQGNAHKASVTDELSERPIIDNDTGRTMSRILFVTSNTAALEEHSEIQNKYLELAGVFDEIHVLVLCNRKGNDSYDRRSDNVWIYSLHVEHWYNMPAAARAAATEAFVFSGNIRPDIIVGTDPYEAGLSALKISKKFDRPLQIHVYEDFYSKIFLQEATHNKWRKRIAKYVLKRTKSIRTNTNVLTDLLTKHFSRHTDIQTLPHFYNFREYENSEPAFDVHEKYSDYTFVMLAFGPLTADSYLHDLFSATRSVLMNPRIGLIVVGTGPAKKLFEEKIKLLGIEKNVVFLSHSDDIFSCYKTADVLIETGTTKASEEHILRAAAAGLPVIAIETNTRKDLFTDGESAFLCPPDDVHCISQKLTKFLNSSTYRIQFAQQGVDISKDRLEEDPISYYRAFRDSIESALLGLSATSKKDGKQKNKKEKKETVRIDSDSGSK